MSVLMTSNQQVNSSENLSSWNSFPLHAMENMSYSQGSATTAADYIQIPLFGLIIILTSFYIIFILTQRTLRKNKFNWLTINVCFASFLFSSVQIFSTTILLLNIPESQISCHVKAFVIDFASCHIMYCHCVSSFCRFLSIRYPQKGLFRSSRWLLSHIFLSGILSILIALPFLFLDGFTCSSSNGKRFLQFYSSFSTLIVPITIVTLCNIAIYHFARQSSKRIHNANQNPTVAVVRLNKRDMYLYKTVIVTFVIFVLGWLPIFIEQMFLNNQSSLPKGVKTLFQVLPAVSLIADVIFLTYTDQAARNLLINACECT